MGTGYFIKVTKILLQCAGKKKPTTYLLDNCKCWCGKDLYIVSFPPAQEHSVSSQGVGVVVDTGFVGPET